METLVVAGNPLEQERVSSIVIETQRRIAEIFQEPPVVGLVEVRNSSPGMMGFVMRAVELMNSPKDADLKDTMGIFFGPERAWRGEYRWPDKRVILLRGEKGVYPTYYQGTIAHELGHALHDTKTNNYPRTPTCVAEAVASMVETCITAVKGAENKFRNILNHYEGRLFDSHVKDGEISNPGKFEMRDAAMLYYIFRMHGQDKLWNVVSYLENPSNSVLINMVLALLENPNKGKTRRQEEYREFESHITRELGFDLTGLRAGALEWYNTNENTVGN